MFEELLRYAAPKPAHSATPVFDATLQAIPLVFEPADRGARPKPERADAPSMVDVSDIAWSEFEPAGWILDILAAEPGNTASDTAAIEAVAALDRVVSFAQAAKIRYLAAFAKLRPPDETERRRPDPLLRRDGTQLVNEFAGDEVASALNLARGAASAQLALAIDLSQRLPVTLRLLETGEIDIAKAKAVADATAPLLATAAAVVEREVLLHGQHRTVAQLRRALRQAVFTVDPTATRQRHKQAAAQRKVTVTPTEDGMAELHALLPADKATALYQRLTALAHASKVPGDSRGIDARRADALSELAIPRPRPHPTAPVNPVQLNVTVGADTLLGLTDKPGHLTGYGPIPATMARELAADATWRRILTDPVSGELLDYGRTTYRPPAALTDHVRARDATCRFPGCGQSADQCDLDHVTAFASGGATCPENLVALCRHHHRMKHHAGWRLDGNPNGTLTWFTPTGHSYQTYPAQLTPHGRRVRVRRVQA